MTPLHYLIAASILQGVGGLMWSSNSHFNVWLKFSLLVGAFLNVVIMIRDWPMAIAYGANILLFGYFCILWRDGDDALNTFIKYALAGMSLWGSYLLITF